MVKEAAEKLGRIDILVNSAARVGGAYTPKLAAITEDDFWSDMNVKVMGYLRCAQAVAPYMIDQGWGRIINLSGGETPDSCGKHHQPHRRRQRSGLCHHLSSLS